MKGYNEFHLFTFNLIISRDVLKVSMPILLNKFSNEFIIQWKLTQLLENKLINAQR